MPIASSELILNPDGSIYHLNLKPANIADIIITVGDQDRVAKVTSYFDEVIFETQKREFKTQTGFYNGKKMTVISTGIGIDNIDIVLNELDALVNIDLETREIKPKHHKLNIVRIGTSGGIQPHAELDKFVMSEAGVGFDGLLHYYKNNITNEEATHALCEHLNISPKKPQPYIVDGDPDLIQLFKTDKNVIPGFTGTNLGFYGPQGRTLRLETQDPTFIDQLVDFKFQEKTITNLEMETSAIYCLSKLLGHGALSMNAIIANRSTGNFSNDPKAAVDSLIQFTLDKLSQL
ncbi:nucleoside phosphorylase [Psychroflexus montanilacus]|uniref:nucleoside phosphorylase n=1 Tax=Psychroflexus montanilacus TaxID=2873598 RepID=UPI001CD0381D|nr:nucleoside phosphorylase [Psychroflexus montanilacus]MBZ9651183.1 nucleoside phosphorylase [Psychroflexus montanilacus]